MRNWSGREEQRLTELWMAGVPLRDIAAKLRRKENNVKYWAYERLKLRRPVRRAPSPLAPPRKMTTVDDDSDMRARTQRFVRLFALHYRPAIVRS